MENLNINEVWAVFLQKIEVSLGKDVCEMWIKPMKILSFQGGVLKIELPSEVWLSTIKGRYENSILQALTEILHVTFSVEYCIAPKEEENKTVIVPDTAPEVKNNCINNIDRHFTFDNFIEGPSNRFAYKAAQAVVKNLGERQYNPFVIFSAPGLGKTHLLHSIGNQILKDNPQAKVVYMSGEGFVSEYIEAVKNKTEDAFRKKYRFLDCLLIDDIQFVVGKERSQEEFFYTFNSLFNNQKQIVLTSDKMPNQLGLEERLSSRILSAVSTEIKRPGLETRIAILRQKRDSNRYDITDDVLAFIAEGVQGSIRELEGCLFRLASYCNIHGVNATVSIAKEVLADILTVEREKYSISINQIKKVVCKYFNISIEDLNSKKKSNSIAWPRQISMYLATELTSLSLPEIGREFNRDHSTVIHAKEKVKDEINNNLLISPIINELINKVKAVDNV